MVSIEGGMGGLGEARESKDEIQALVDEAKNDIISQSGKNFPHLKVVNYRSQVVAGTNYFIKCHTGDDHIHVKIFKPLPVYGNQLKVTGIQHGKSHDDPIDYF